MAATLYKLAVQPSALVTHYDQVVSLDGERFLLSLYTCTQDEASPSARGTKIYPEDRTAPETDPKSRPAPMTEVTGGWCLDIYDLPATPVVVGIALSCGLDLLWPYRHLHVPQGQLFVWDKLASGRDPDPDGFSEGRYELCYLSAA